MVNPLATSQNDVHKQILAELPLGLLLLDSAGRITYLNPVLADLLEIAPVEVEGQAMWLLAADSSAQHALQSHLTSLPEKQSEWLPFFTCLQGNRDTPIEVRLDWSCHTDDSGQLCGFLLVVSDITDQINLEREHQFHIEILHNLAEGVCLFRALDGVVIYNNPKFDALFGYQANEMIGKPIELVDATVDKEAEQIAQEIFTAIDNYGVWSGEIRNRRKDGSEFWSNTTISSFQHPEYGLLWISLHEDITDKKQAQEVLQRSEKKYRDLFENSRDAILIIENEMFVDCNQATLDMLGYRDKKEFLQQHPSKLSPPTQPDGRDSEEKADEMMQIALEKGSNRFEWDHVRANGEAFPVEVLLTPLMTEKGVQVIHTVWRDITVQKQQREKILYQALYDSLTDLPNRVLALDRLDQLIKDAHRRNDKVAVLFLDLDDFKKVNDNLGHEWGDKILLEAAIRLRAALRADDTVGRLGGDEFIILLHNLEDAADAAPVAIHLIEQFRKPFVVDQRELILTASIGVACYPDDGESTSDLLRLADTAMYHSKEQGRNSFHYFTEAMNKEASRKLLVEEQLQGALSRQEFYLHFQPLISVEPFRIVGAEALLRWHNAELGFVPPDEFIAVAEQTGHIVQIGEFVMMEALKKAAQWQAEIAKQFKIAVNVSPRQFRDPNLLAGINSCLEATALTGDSLELEITEGVLLTGHASVQAALQQLNQMGVGLAMDDFGTGYSSMSYLRTYPFDTLKVDRSFIRDILTDNADKELVSATIGLAHSLGLKVVAEGVETEEQFRYLATQGCDYCQGYYFSKPLAADEFAELLARGVG